MIITSEPDPVLGAYLGELHNPLDLMSPADFDVLRLDLLKLLRTMMTMA